MLENPGGMFKLSRILVFWRQNPSALERRINNLGSNQGAELALKLVTLTAPIRRFRSHWSESSRPRSVAIMAVPRCWPSMRMRLPADSNHP